MLSLAKGKANEGTETMNQINKSSKNISEIIKIIDHIASQANLLALNAAIEAARAGESGRGFAAIASEIRDLANRSLETVKQIDYIVKESLLKVDEGGKMAKIADKVLDEIVGAVDETANIASILLNNSEKQKIIIKELIEGTKHLVAVGENTSSNSQESAEISEQLASQAESLKQLMEYFRLKA